MNLIRNLPGPLLIFLGALSLSFGGLIVKSFDGATLWQILFWRSLFFSLTILIFLLISYKKKTLNSFYESGLAGFFGGIPPPINPNIDGLSLTNKNAQIGPRTDSDNIIIPTIADGVLRAPIVININPKPT